MQYTADTIALEPTTCFLLPCTHPGLCVAYTLWSVLQVVYHGFLTMFLFDYYHLDELCCVVMKSSCFLQSLSS